MSVGILTSQSNLGEKKEKGQQIINLEGDVPNDEMEIETLDSPQNIDLNVDKIIKEQDKQILKLNNNQSPNISEQKVKSIAKEPEQKSSKPQNTIKQTQQSKLDFIKSIDSKDKLLNVAEVLEIPAVQQHMKLLKKNVQL